MFYHKLVLIKITQGTECLYTTHILTNNKIFGNIFDDFSKILTPSEITTNIYEKLAKKMFIVHLVVAFYCLNFLTKIVYPT